MNDAKPKPDAPQRRTPRRIRRFLLPLGLGAALTALAAVFCLPWLLDYYTDGFTIHQPLRDAQVRNVLWEDPEPLAGRINDHPENYEPTLSADGLAMIFTRGKAKQNADLYAALWNGRDWDEPQPLEAINSEADELGPELSRDGRYLYFYSNRAGGLGGYDIWVSRRGPEGWTYPENLGPAVNSEFNEYGPGLTPDGRRLYYSSNRLERPLTQEEKDAWQATLRENFLSCDYDIFAAELAAAETAGAAPAPPLPRFAEAQRLAILNSPADEGQVAMTPRGDFIYFSSNRRGGQGAFDIYRSRILYGELQDPENMGAPVNSARDDMDPALVMEGHGLLLSSNRLAEDGRSPFKIFRTVSREVITEKDYSALAALLRLLDKLKWPLLFLILGLLALLWLLRYLMSQRFRMVASLLQRCLLASLLLHLLLALLFSTWVVATGLCDLEGDSLGDMMIDTDALAGERIGLEIREHVTDLAASRDSRTFDDPVEIMDTLEEDEPLAPAMATFEPTAQSTAFAVEPAMAPLKLPDPRTLDAAAHAASLDRLQASDNNSRFEEPERIAGERQAEIAPLSSPERSDFQADALPEADLPSAGPDPARPDAADLAALDARPRFGSPDLSQVSHNPDSLPVEERDLPAPQNPALEGTPDLPTPSALEEPDARPPRNADGRAEGRKELPALNHRPGPVARMDLDPQAYRSGAAPVTTRPALDGETARATKSAVTEIDRPAAAQPESDLPPVARADLPLAPGPEPPVERNMETFDKTAAADPSASQSRPDASRSESADPDAPVRLNPLADASSSGPAPLRFETGSIRPATAVRSDLEKRDRLPAVTMDLPDRPHVAHADTAVDRFVHGTPRTYHGLEMRSRRVVFCLDVSGSMEWNNRIGEARQELIRLLETLDETVEFNIIAFSGRVRVWNRHGVQGGSRENIASAKNFVMRIRIGSDGTNTAGALEAALADSNVETVYFLSDGHPTVGFTTNPGRILRFVRELQDGRNVVIHTIAYVKGDPPPAWRRDVPAKGKLINLMKNLADQNNGNAVVFE